MKYMGVGGFILADTCMEEYQPWLRPSAARYIESMLPKNANVFEWGMGASTIWLAKMGCKIITSELDADWLLNMHIRIGQEGVSEHIIVEDWSILNPPNIQGYADLVIRYDDNSFDFILIDGRNRCRCLGNARSKVKVGGILCLDNTEREEYSKAVKLMETWDGYYWGDEGWYTSVWIRLPESEVERVIFPNEDA